MKKASTIPPSLAIKNGLDVVPTADPLPKGRYKNTMLTPRQQYPASTTLSPGFLRSFGFASRTFQLETSEGSIKISQDLSETGGDKLNTKSPSPQPQPSGLSISSISVAPATMQNGSVKQAQNVVLSESRLNFMSHNLSEIADRVSPTKFDAVGEDGVGSSETLSRKSQTHSEISGANSDQSRTKTPYSRKGGGDSKSYVSRQKSFARRRNRDRRSSKLEVHNGELPLNAEHNHNGLLEVEPVKLDAETDSGYNSSFSTSVSLSEEIEASKSVSLDNGSNTDVDTDELLFSITDCTFKEKLHGADALSSLRTTHQKSSQSDALSPERTSDQNVSKFVALPSHRTSDLEERLDSLIHGMSSDLKDASLESTSSPQKAVSSTDLPDRKMTEMNDHDNTSSSFKLPDNEGLNVVEGNTQVQERSNSSPDVQFQLSRGKESQDDRSSAKTKTGRRPGILRRRSTLVSFRPPKQMSVQEGESDVVEMDEAGFVQLLTDMKSLKTQLLKLKRELQEADVVSPLSHSHSCLVRRPSAPLDSDSSLSRLNSPHGKPRMSLKRNMTMDAAAMQERLHRSGSFDLSGAPSEDNAGNTNHDINEFLQTNKELVKPPSVKEASLVQESKEVKNLRVELEEVKKKLIETSQERDSLVIQREELEHELDSKNHTIRMLQKQLEVQDNRDEMAYLKRQVKSLTDQIRQQQQTITGLRYRTASPGSVTMATVSTRFQQKKDLVKADIRNRLRDAFVRHLGESSRNHTQLSKHIQKAERNINVAQKGKSRSSSERLNSDKSQEDSDGGGPELNSTKSTRCQRASGSFERNKRDSDGTDSESQSYRSSPRRSVSPKFERHSKEVDGSASESDSGKGSRRWLMAGSESRGDSDGTDSESHSAKSRRWRSACQGLDRNKEEDGSTSESDSGKAIRRWLRASSLEKSKENTDEEDSSSRHGPNVPSRRHTKSPVFEGVKSKLERSDVDSQSTKLNRQRKLTPSTSAARKTSHSKYTGSTLDTPLLSHSWTAGTIEKIVKSWRESPETEGEAKEEKAFEPVAHFEFL